MKLMIALLALLTVCTATLIAEGNQPAPAAAPAAKESVLPPRQGRPGRQRQRPDSPAMNRKPPRQNTERLQRQMAELTEMYDADKDGALSAEEKAALNKDMETAKKLRQYIPSYDTIQTVDVNQDMKLSEDEIKEMPKRMREASRKRRQELRNRPRPNRAKRPAPTAPPAAPAPAPAEAK